MSQVAVIAIVGGECSGKSSSMASIVKGLQEHGWHTLVIRESAEEFITGNFSPLHLGVEKFQEHIFTFGRFKEEFFKKIGVQLSDELGVPVAILVDRGSPDTAVFHEPAGPHFEPPQAYHDMIAKFGFTHFPLLLWFDGVVHLVTAADGAEAFYVTNEYRKNTPQQARYRDKRVQAAWSMHPKYMRIDNSTGFEEKKQRALNAVLHIIGVPEHHEIERQYEVRNFTPACIPAGAHAIEIEQHYLVDAGGELASRRIRKSTFLGSAVYEYGEKIGPKRNRVEIERLISADEFERLLGEADSNFNPIVKTRHCFVYESKRFELDVFKEQELGRVCLEVELQREDEEVKLPPWLDLVEVTDDPNWTNKAIARKKK